MVVRASRRRRRERRVQRTRIGRRHSTDDVRNVVAHVDRATFLQHGLGDAQVGLGLGVGVFFHRLVEAARDHIIGDGHATFPRLFPDVLEDLVDVGHHHVRLVTTEKEI